MTDKSLGEALENVRSYLKVFERSLPEQFECRLCGAKPEDDHRPDCELVQAERQYLGPRKWHQPPGDNPQAP